MIAFADSSAVVTAYASSEPNVLPAKASLVVSGLARVEVPSALWRKVDLDEITAADGARLVNEFEADWREARFRVMPMRSAILVRAAALTATHGLRTLDAIQLASALAARDVEPECRAMVVLDDRLRRAAATERFDILPA